MFKHKNRPGDKSTLTDGVYLLMALITGNCSLQVGPEEEEGVWPDVCVYLCV